MIEKIVMMGLMGLMLGCGRTDAPEPALQRHERVYSTVGFSFLPPPGEGWTEEFGKSRIMYSKKTDPTVVSVFAGAEEIKLPAPLADTEALLSFVRKKKDAWGIDGRYTPVSSSFLAESQHASCVRYQMTVNDHGANNRGTHEFLLLHAVGRFCTHPRNPVIAVDIFHSTRHIPGYDASSLSAEGDAFLDSLMFNTPPPPSQLTPAPASERARL
jgi:hypothetical protein